MDRIEIDTLARMVIACKDAEVRAVLQRCLNTIVEMDKDIAVYIAQIESLQRQHNAVLYEQGE